MAKAHLQDDAPEVTGLDRPATHSQADMLSVRQSENAVSAPLVASPSASSPLLNIKHTSADTVHFSGSYSDSLPLQGPQLSLRSSLPSDDLSLWLREKFPQIPLDDVLFASYSCALVKAIMLQGRLYVTTSALIFYAKIFGKVTKEYLPLNEIRAVTKRRSGFVANAIKVTLMNPDISPVVFGSLNKRERACALIKARLQAINPTNARASDDDDYSPDEGDIWRCQSLSSAPSQRTPANDLRSKSVPILTSPSLSRKTIQDSSDSGTTSDSSEQHVLSSRRTRPPRHDNSAYAVASYPDQPDVSDFDFHYSHPAVQKLSNPQSRNVVVNSIKGDDIRTRDLLWRTDQDVVDVVAGKEYSKRVEQGRAVLDAPVQLVFDALFAGDWLLQCHSRNGNTGLSETGWARAEDGFMTRTLRFNRALGYRLGPKTTRVIETQKYSFTSAGGALVELSGHNLDVPFGDSFRVESYLELSPVAAAGVASGATLLVTSVAVHFAKNTMLRSKIESGALVETKQTFGRMLDLAAHRIDEVKSISFPASRHFQQERVNTQRGKDTPLDGLESSAVDCVASPRNVKEDTSQNSGTVINTAHTSKDPASSSLISTARETRDEDNGAKNDAVSDLPSRAQDRSSLTVDHVLAFATDSSNLSVAFLLMLGFITILLFFCVLLLLRLRSDIHRLEQFASLQTSAVSNLLDAKGMACKLVQNSDNASM